MYLLTAFPLTIAILVTSLGQMEMFPGWSDVLLRWGVVGIVLYWLMIRVEKRLKDQERATDTLSESILLQVISLEATTETARKRAKDLLDEIELVRRARGDRPKKISHEHPLGR